MDLIISLAFRSGQNHYQEHSLKKIILLKKLKFSVTVVLQEFDSLHLHRTNQKLFPKIREQTSCAKERNLIDFELAHVGISRKD